MGMRGRWIICGSCLALLLASTALATPRPYATVLSPKIVVPARYPAMKSRPCFVPDHDRYLAMYRQAYRQCIRNYARNIRYKTTAWDRDACGWDSEILGYQAGYDAAEKAIRRDIRSFGEKRMAKYLKGLARKMP